MILGAMLSQALCHPVGSTKVNWMRQGMARDDFYDDKQDNPVGKHTTHRRRRRGLAQCGLVSSKRRGLMWFDQRDLEGSEWAYVI